MLTDPEDFRPNAEARRRNDAPRSRTAKAIRLLGIVSFVLLGSVPTIPRALAHHETLERSFFIEPSGSDWLEIVVHLVVPPTRPLAALADSNADGSLSAEELERAKAELTVAALDGLTLRVGSEARKLEQRDARVRGLEGQHTTAGRGAHVELMVYGRVRVPPARIEIALENAATSLPLLVIIVPTARTMELTPLTPGFRWSARGSRSRLQPGKELRWLLGASK